MLPGTKALKFIVASIAVPLLFAGCSTTGPVVRTLETVSDVGTEAEAQRARAEAFSWRGRPENQVAPGYEVELSSAADEKLNGRYRVSFAGDLDLPYGVTIRAAGLTEQQLKREIGRAYTEYFRTEPNVLINISDKKYWVDVRGLVAKPGTYLVRRDSSLDEVIAQANSGDTQGERAVGGIRYARITQGGRSLLINMADYYAGMQNVAPRWQGGETVFLQSAGGEDAASGSPTVVQIIGEVRSPGEYQYTPAMDAVDYLVRAGGPSERAALHNVEILRREGAQKKSISFSLVQNDPRIEMPRLRAGDILVVHADNPSEAERYRRAVAEVSSIITGFATVIILALTL
jgi:protein involved in polysaccharide export with SLBB domain